MSSEKNLRVLVFAPHPDDDLIGCGGSMAKHLKKEDEVFVVYVTYGDADCPEYEKKEFRKIRKGETESASGILGIKKENLFFLDEKPWKLSEEKIRFEFLRLIRKIKPDVCYIPHSEDNHVDHRIVGRAALDAINMAPGKWFSRKKHACPPIRIVLAYEVWTPLTAPNYFENVDAFLEIKMTALREHKTQAVEKYERACRGLNAFRGAMQAGSNYAEAFQVLKISQVFFQRE